MAIPAYFEPIRSRAAERWKQLERDPELAGPWHQLFKQVQSPRHVISELLQNADDAGATEATVDINDGEFVFSHNGEDFIEEHFTSLCRFGYSNKRALHTIGFRGIGFKSTFSLGDEVRLFTPTLSVVFRKKRFTEPLWLNNGISFQKRTEVRVLIKDEYCLRELKKNLTEWLKSPGSLLFFKSIRCLRIGEQEVSWRQKGAGPIDDSEWMALSTSPEHEYLLVRSPAENFPPDSLEEIRQERMVTDLEETAFPPCRVEIVLGMEGRLFVILPTGVRTDLPFASNAPFIQDPARVKIKDPETSPTNRWLLKRVGDLAADAMLEWLNRKSLGIAERCGAYQFLPELDRDTSDNTLERNCAALAAEAFLGKIAVVPFILTETETLESWDNCVAVPVMLLDIWSAEQVSAFFADAHPILCRHVSYEGRSKLINKGCVKEKDKDHILKALEAQHLPKPDAWRQLLFLWAYVSEEVIRYRWNGAYRGVKIIPAQGKDVLYAAGEVVRLGEKRLLQSAEDWEFLSAYLLVLNPNWPRFLAEQRREAEEKKDTEITEQVGAAYRVLTELKMDDASDANRVIQQVADAIFSQEKCTLTDCVRISHLAAAFDAAVSEDFQFVTQDGYRRMVKNAIALDINGDLDIFMGDQWCASHVLHDSYTNEFYSCSKNDWKNWTSSGHSRLLTFVPLVQKQSNLYGRTKLKNLLAAREVQAEPRFHYVTTQFVIEDWDFDQSLWQRWRTTAANDPEFWGRLLSRILKQPSEYWSKAIVARALQVSTGGTMKPVTYEPLLPIWLLQFRSLPCLQDTWGHYREPAELLRRTPETETLLDIEPFVRAEYDTEATRPLLMKLGVRDTPTGPDRLLERIVALAQAENPPIYEVEKWYHRLDNMISNCSTEEMQRIRDAFHSQKIILTESNSWARLEDVFLSADEEDVPGAAIIHPTVRNLLLWHKIGVAEKPTIDLVIEWLRNLVSGQALSTDELRRVRSLLPRYPERLWNECGHWLNLEGEWAPVRDLAFALTMQSLVPWKHLFPAIKQRTADFQKLPAELCRRQPFSDLPMLGSSIEERIREDHQLLSHPQPKPWLSALGSSLQRIILDDEAESQRIQELGARLSKTSWHVASGLETIPYIDGVPAGTSRRIDVLWKDEFLYVEDRTSAKMAKAVSQELGRVFGRQEIADAIKLCYERSQEFVEDYIAENFKLMPQVDTLTTGPAPAETLPVVIEPLDPAPDSEDKAHWSVVNGETEISPLPTGGESRGEEERKALPEPSAEEEERDSRAGDESDSGQTVIEVTPKPHKPPQPSLIERYALASGYSKDGQDRFYRDDGSWLQKVSGSSFPWELHSPGGNIVKYLWPKDHCIQQEPLELDSDIWALCEKFPDTYSLLLVSLDGSPVEISGRQLRKMSDSGELVLHPATYRLVYRNE